jgi:hypothetical protein
MLVETATVKVRETGAEAPGTVGGGLAGNTGAGEVAGPPETKEAEMITTGIRGAGMPSGKRITPDKTPVEVTGGREAAGTKLEKSIDSTSPPDPTVTTRASAAFAVPG